MYANHTTIPSSLEEEEEEEDEEEEDEEYEDEDEEEGRAVASRGSFVSIMGNI